MCFKKYIQSFIISIFCIAALNAQNESGSLDEQDAISSEQEVMFDDLQAQDFNGFFLTVGIQKDTEEVDAQVWQDFFEVYKKVFSDIVKDLAHITENEEGIKLSVSLDMNLAGDYHIPIIEEGDIENDSDL